MIKTNFLAHRVVLTLYNNNAEAEDKLYMYFPTVEQSGMAVYLIRRCLMHKHFKVEQFNYSNRAYVQVSAGKVQPVSRSEQEYVEHLSKQEQLCQHRSTYCVKRWGTECEQVKFSMWFRNQLEFDFTCNLLKQGLKSIIISISNERKDSKYRVWLPYRVAEFVDKECARLYLSLTDSNKEKALQAMALLREEQI